MKKKHVYNSLDEVLMISFLARKQKYSIFPMKTWLLDLEQLHYEKKDPTSSTFNHVSKKLHNNEQCLQ